MFDPYRDWLGITDERRPPTLYQLLGLPAGAADARAIEAAASGQIAKVQSHIAGSHAKEAWRLVDEITLAKSTLLDPAKRSAYDAIFGFGPKHPGSTPGMAPPVSPPVGMGWGQGAPPPTAPLPTAPFPTAPFPAGLPPHTQSTYNPPAYTPTYGPPPVPAVPFPAAPFPASASPPVYSPAPMPVIAPFPQEELTPQPLYTPIPVTPRSAPPAVEVGFLNEDEHHANDDPSSQGLPTPVGMPKPRRHQRGGSGAFMIVGGIIVLGLIGGGIYLATRDKPATGDSKEVADNSGKKTINPTPAGPESRIADKDKKSKDVSKKSGTDIKKKAPPKPPDPPPPLEIASEFKDAKLLRGHEATPRALAVSPDGKLLLTAGDDMAVFTWSPSGEKGSRRKNLNSPAVGVAFLPGGKEAMVADGGRIYLIDLATNKDAKVWTVPANSGSFSTFAMSSDGKFMVTGTTIGKLFWWDASKSDFSMAMDATEAHIEQVALADDGKTILAGGRDGTLSAWDGPSGRMQKKWKGHPGGVAGVAFSPDGKLMGSAGVDNLVKVWDRSTFGEILSLKGHTNVPVALAWSADSTMIVTSGIDKTIRLWDSATGLPLRWSHTAGDKVWSLALDPKDRFLIAGMSDGGVQLLFLPAVRPDYPPRSTWVQAPQVPQPAPLPYLIEPATKALREKYKADFALTAPEDQQALYEKLLGRAKIAPDDPASRFALFREARDLAVRTGRMEDAFKAVDVCANWFEIDELEEKAAALKEAGKGMVTRTVVEAAANVLDLAEKLARADIVDELLRQRELFPQLADAADANARIQAAEKRWTSAASDREAGKRLVTDWMKDPDNVETNLAYGKHLCFRLGQWSEGLPRLLKGGDAMLKDMATKDQATPKDGKSQLELAKAWVDYAAKADEGTKAGALLRAKFWYDQASRASDLPAGEKNSANARIGEINRQVEALPNAPSNRGGVPVKRQQFNTIRNALALETQWAMAGTDGLSPEGLLFKGEGALVSRFRVLDACRVEFAFVPDGREVTIQLNGESASFKPAITTAAVFVIAERKAGKVTLSLKSFTGTVVEEKSANLTAGKEDASAVTFKIGGGADKGGVLLKSIVVQGMVRPVD